MKSIVSVSHGRIRFPAIVKAVEKGEMITITRANAPVACLVGYDWLTSLIESMDLMCNPEAMKALRDYQAGKMKFGSIEDIPE